MKMRSELTNPETFRRNETEPVGRRASLLLLLAAVLFALPNITGCKKTETEPLANLQSLNGSWKSDDFPIPVTVNFSTSDTTAKISTIASNSYFFNKGDVFWRGVIATGAKSYHLAQLTKSKSGYYVFITGKATLTSSDRLDIVYSGSTDDTGQLKLDGLRATFTKE